MLIIIPILVLGSFLLTTIMGYWIHRAFHKEWSGIFYRTHLTHHVEKYPASDFTSDKYRSAGGNGSFLYFILAFLPFLAGIGGICYVLHISAWYYVLILVSMITTGMLHESIHDSFHLNKTIWSKLPWYSEWQSLHWKHHRFVQRNFGVFIFTLDKLFQTYKQVGKSSVYRKISLKRSEVIRQIDSSVERKKGIQGSI